MVSYENTEWKSTGQDIIYLASCAINSTIPEKTRVEAMDLDAIYELAEKHMIKAMIALALESAGYRDTRSGKAIASALRKLSVYEENLREIIKRLEEKGIWYMPFKGAVIKDYYPKQVMREFSDYDILCDPDRTEDIKEIMEDLGFYIYLYEINYHDIYYKDPFLNFEMHKRLFDEDYEEELNDHYKTVCAYYDHVEDRLSGDGYKKHLSAEDTYVYMIAHDQKHYAKFGIGLRSLIDNYVFLKSEKPDMDYVKSELEKMGIEDFEVMIRETAMSLFGEGGMEIPDGKVFEYIMSSGFYAHRSRALRKT